MKNETIAWSELYQARRAIQEKHKNIWNVPIRKRYSHVIKEFGASPKKVLEVGAGNKNLLIKLKGFWDDIEYCSFDIDRSNHHDFYSVDEIRGSYDLICMFEVIEHVTPMVAKEILAKCYQVLKPGGKIMITTPNTYNPPNYLRDATHITPWCYDELGAIALMCGFNVDHIFRLYHSSFIRRFMHRVVLHWLHAFIGIDYSKQIIMVASKTK